MLRISALMGCALWLGAVLVTPHEACAQTSVIEDDPSLEDEARSLFEAGRAAYEAARYDSALNYFRQAYAIVPRPALLFNMGAAADRLQQSAQALEWYRGYLEALPGATNRAAVERRITFLEGVLANAAPAAPVATPEQAAATVAPSGSTPADGPPSGGGDITGEWWFWTLIAVLVVGAGVGITAGVVASSGQLEAPLPGDFPATMALRLE